MLQHSFRRFFSLYFFFLLIYYSHLFLFSFIFFIPFFCFFCCYLNQRPNRCMLQQRFFFRFLFLFLYVCFFFSFIFLFFSIFLLSPQAYLALTKAVCYNTAVKKFLVTLSTAFTFASLHFLFFPFFAVLF